MYLYLLSFIPSYAILDSKIKKTGLMLTFSVLETAKSQVQKDVQ